MKQLTLKHDDPPIHLNGQATSTPKYTVHLQGTEPASFAGKTACLDLTPTQLVNLRDRINLALEGQADD